LNLESGICRIFLSKAACFVRNLITLSLSIILFWNPSLNLYVALKVGLSELVRAENKFVFEPVKRSLLLVLSSFVLLHQESSEMSLETCFYFCTKDNVENS
jgi:hypothetical protein